MSETFCHTAVVIIINNPVFFKLHVYRVDLQQQINKKNAFFSSPVRIFRKSNGQ